MTGHGAQIQASVSDCERSVIGAARKGHVSQATAIRMFIWQRENCPEDSGNSDKLFQCGPEP